MVQIHEAENVAPAMFVAEPVGGRSSFEASGIVLQSWGAHFYYFSEGLRSRNSGRAFGARVSVRITLRGLSMTTYGGSASAGMEEMERQASSGKGKLRK